MREKDKYYDILVGQGVIRFLNPSEEEQYSLTGRGAVSLLHFIVSSKDKNYSGYCETGFTSSSMRSDPAPGSSRNLDTMTAAFYTAAVSERYKKGQRNAL